MRPLHEQFLLNAKRFRSKPAIIDRFTEKTYTYERALIASILLAQQIKVTHEGMIGIMLPTGAGCMLSILGVLMSGKIPVMINYSTNAAENCAYAQNKCGFRTVITSKAFIEKIDCRAVHGMRFIEDMLASIGTLARVQAALKCKLPTRLLLASLPAVQLDDTVVILFTSGSEKDPKAVQLTHRNIGSNVRDVINSLDIGAHDIFMSNLPLFHVFGHNIDFWLPLCLGATMVTYPNPLDYRRICQIVREQKATLMVGTPAFFSGYLRQSQPGDFASLRVVVAGADKLPETLREAYFKQHGIALLEGYGTTETSPVISSNLPLSHKPGSIGKPLPSVNVRITDIKSGEILRAGQEGMIEVKGELVMKGYFDDIEETALRIKDGWYETGDMGLLDEEGYLWHRGRLRRFVKIGGEMVSLVKVEVVLSAALGDESIECCVVEVPDSRKGARIVAVVTRPIATRAILKQMAADLPPIALPKEFLVMECLPKMGSGKVDFRAITEIVRRRVLQDESDAAD